jgi:hypothetical protein
LSLGIGILSKSAGLAGEAKWVDLVQFSEHIYVGANIVVEVFEGCLFEMSCVLQGAGSEVVHAQHMIALGEEPLAEVATRESGTARHEC